MHGLDAAVTKPKESDEALQGLMLENQTELQHQPQQKDSISGNPLLTRYFFVVDHGVKRSSVERQMHELSATSDVKEKDIREAGSAPLKMCEGGEPVVRRVQGKAVGAPISQSSLGQNPCP